MSPPNANTANWTDKIMTVSSQTPDSSPGDCPLCDTVSGHDRSPDGNDSVCPRCGCRVQGSSTLLRSISKRFGEISGTAADTIDAKTRFDDLGLDSLDMLELIMEFEEEFDVEVSDVIAQKMQTVGDVVRSIEEQRRQ